MIRAEAVPTPDLSQTLALSLDLKKTLTLAVNRIAGFMQAEAASMFLIEPGSNVLECKICVGPADILGLKLAIGQGVVGRTVAQNKPQVVLDAQHDATQQLDERSIELRRLVVRALDGGARGHAGLDRE